ncbi:MAG: bifunctional riboflavin kinase/FAD synthetase [Lachnospiraceae bacterium]|jgi:riboflavin kinase/FMN adenylyltransferase|nr:bifunctional riboflavin kinase/FAD synthetase [Lachnospiraceae bacterium]
MQFFRNTTNIEIKEDTVITLGKFDGLHKGHRFLMEGLRMEKHKHHLKSVVFTFSTFPRDEIENKKHAVLLTLKEKETLFEKAGVDYVVEYPFTKDVRMMEPEEFVEMLVKRLHVKIFVIGTDFFFGYQKRGNYQLLQKLSEKYDYKVVIITKKQVDGVDISSTRIRELIANGQIEKANLLLGYDYFFEGIVETGNRIGHTIGIPTVNLYPDDNKLLPPFGVYASCVEIGKRSYYGLTNVGVKPTVGERNPVGIETHILDFDDMIYGENIRVHLKYHIRDEIKFNGIETLKNQINKDIEAIKNYINITKC